MRYGQLLIPVGGEVGMCKYLISPFCKVTLSLLSYVTFIVRVHVFYGVLLTLEP